jgi:hypothetical protein
MQMMIYAQSPPPRTNFIYGESLKMHTSCTVAKNQCGFVTRPFFMHIITCLVV